MTSKKAVEWLNKMRDLALGAPNADQKSAAVIQDFLARAPSAGYDEFLRLQGRLIEALKSTKFVYTCLARKLNAITTVTDGCKKGFQTLTELYKNAVMNHQLNAADCVANGIPYTNADVIFKIVKKTAGHQRWYTNCLLNNENLLYRVCSEWRKG
jgi:hypothetical protein